MSFQVEHINCYLIQELLKILNIYNIKNKLFDVVTNNASNNNTLKEKLKKTLNRRDTS